jgi:hypothetical protein
MRLVFAPFMQAMCVGALTLAISRSQYAVAWVISLALNLLWWMNTRTNHDTRHVRFAGVVYAVSFASGTITGMCIINLASSLKGAAP